MVCARGIVLAAMISALLHLLCLAAATSGGGGSFVESVQASSSSSTLPPRTMLQVCKFEFRRWCVDRMGDPIQCLLLHLGDAEFNEECRDWVVARQTCNRDAAKAFEKGLCSDDLLPRECLRTLPRRTLSTTCAKSAYYESVLALRPRLSL